MSLLATKLFDLSPNRSHWSTSYRGNLPIFLPSSSSHLLSTKDHLQPTSTKDLLTLFRSLQSDLFDAVSHLQTILDLQDTHLNLTRQIKSKHSALLSFSHQLKHSVSLLDSLLDDYSPNYSTSLTSTLNLNHVLSYAHKISYTTFAPPEHSAGAPLRGALPPAPQDNEMRASQLYHFADLDVGAPKKAAEKDSSAVDAVAEVVLMEPALTKEEAVAPLLPIAVPPGWKKGMPVELPVELPPVPPGWRPGDPLPNLDGVVVPMVVPEAIQVKHVDLDITHQDDSSSYESSGVGSSDEDDDD